MKKLDDVMVDLETLGNRAGCQILSIGACFFSRNGSRLGAKFYGVCGTGQNAQTYLGLRVDASTIKWWSEQSEKAREVLEISRLESTSSLTETLRGFEQWLAANAASKDVRVWGNGSDFDNAILYAAYMAVGIKVPWNFYNSRCFRTLKSEFKSVQVPKRKGTHHNALDDAVHQAKHAAAIFKSIAAPQVRRGL